MSSAAAAPPSPAPGAGLSLEQYAGLTAALVEGFPAPDVLALETLDETSWRASSASWKLELAGAGPEGPLFREYRDKLVVAEDWLTRPIDPLDGDLAAWLAFLGAFSAHAAPFELLQSLGLGMNDLARMQRRWAKRMSEDEQLGKKAAELAKKQPGELPRVRAGEAKLKPFPWSKAGARSAPRLQQAAAAAALGRPIDDELGLDRYASISVELALDPKGAAGVLARYGLSQGELEAADQRWKARIEADPALERDWRGLYAYYHARFGAFSKQAQVIDARRAPAELPEPPPPPISLPTPISSPAPIPPPAPIFASTSLSLSIPTRPGAAVRARSGAGGDRQGLSRRGEGEAASRRSRWDLTLGRRPARPRAALRDLTGAGAQTGARPEPKPEPKPVPLAGTSLALDVPRGPALPFVAGEAPPAVAESSPASAKEKRPGDALRGTSLAVDVPREPALPFDPPPARAKPNKLAELSFGLQVPRELLQPRPAPSPPKAEAAPPSALPKPPPPSVQATPWSPELTLEQYASLCAELAMRPERAAEVLARYRQTAESRARLDQHYRARVEGSPEVRAAWERAYQAYYEWLKRSGGPR